MKSSRKGIQAWQERFYALDQAAVRERIEEGLSPRDARTARAVLFGEGPLPGGYTPDIEEFIKIWREDGLLAFLEPRLPFTYAHEARKNAARFSGESRAALREEMGDAGVISRSGGQRNGGQGQTYTLSRAAEAVGVSRFKLSRDLPKMGYARKGRTEVYSFLRADLARMREFYARDVRLPRAEKAALITLVAQRRNCIRDAARAWIDRRLKKGATLEEIAEEARRRGRKEGPRHAAPSGAPGALQHLIEKGVEVGVALLLVQLDEHGYPRPSVG